MSFTQRTCKHDEHFFCMGTHNPTLPSAVWACSIRGCGFWLNFDPTDYLGSVAILTSPSPQVKWKSGPTMDSHEVGK